MQHLLRDLRFSLRMLLKHPGTSAVALLTLALGIGANTAVFSFVNALFLRPLPAHEPERLVRLYATAPGRPFDVMSFPNFADVRDRNRAFTALAVHQPVELTHGAAGSGDEIYGELVSGDYFRMLGLSPLLGRLLVQDDDREPGAYAVAVISHRWWRDRHAGDPSIVGRTIHLNGYPFVVVGIAPEGFKGTYDVFTSDVWAPIAMHEQLRPRGLKLTSRGWGWLHATGRLRDGVTREQAQDDVGRIAAALRREHPQTNRELGFNLRAARAFPEQFEPGVSRLLVLFMVVVGLVLLAACANIGSTLLARVMERRREIAMRRALGASRAALARQWLTESLVLALLAAGLGLLVALWSRDALLMLRPRLQALSSFGPNLALDWRVFAFTLATASATSMAFGWLPAMRAARANVLTALKDEPATASARRSRMQALFVASQVTVSLMLLVVAGLLVRSLSAALTFHPGFDAGNLLVASVSPQRHGYDRTRGLAFYREAAARVRALPGVRDVTLAAVVPLSDTRESRAIRIDGYAPPDGTTTVSVATNIVAPGYFETLGIPLVAGRAFPDRDADDRTQPSAVVNQTMARRFWPGGQALGRRIFIGAVAVEIVGIARDITYYGLGEPPRPYLYLPLGPVYLGTMTLHVRASGGTPLAASVRRELQAIAPQMIVFNVMRFDELRQIPLFPTRALAIAASVFGGLTLLLTTIGVYGLLAYSVSQRTREIGVRMALGAERRDIVGMVLTQGLKVTAYGLAAGVAAAVALARLLGGLLFGVSPGDPLTFATSSLLLASVALITCYVPARRACRIDPISALRHE